MSLKDRLQRQLKQCRDATEGAFASFSTPEQWTHQVHGKANHPLWVAGHLALSDNFFLGVIQPERMSAPEGWDAKFGMGSQPVSDPAEYPAADEVMAYFRDRRATLLDVLESVEESQFETPTPEGTPDFIPDFGAIFEAAIWHEGVHFGQVTIAHRGLGFAPLFAPPPKEEAVAS